MSIPNSELSKPKLEFRHFVNMTGGGLLPTLQNDTGKLYYFVNDPPRAASRPWSRRLRKGEDLMRRDCCQDVEIILTSHLPFGELREPKKGRPGGVAHKMAKL